jgi:alanine dehydrogenase
MKNVIGILRESRTKRGEKRVAITPDYAKQIVNWGHRLIVQPAKNPEVGEIKRIFEDKEYKKAGAEISEDMTPADVIFGLKEITIRRIIPGKVYFFFSHTYKGQNKNRDMLKALINKKTTVVDFELIRDSQSRRLITAFTFNAGYAGMVDTLWTLGRRLSLKGIANAFEKIPQAVEGEDLKTIKDLVYKIGEKIKLHGTPEEIPPIITCFLGKGKTSFGAQEIYDLLPVEEISLNQLEDIYKYGSRKKVYKLILRVTEMYRLKLGHEEESAKLEKLPYTENRQHYLTHPDLYESNLDKVLPFVTLLMNCIIWSRKYPRSLSKALMKEIYKSHKTLIVIGDITCDPNGSIEFTKETWIDNPVYIYNPINEKITDGFEESGIAVMAVTNLPCEFSAEASRQFSEDLFLFLKKIVNANYKGSLKDSNLPDEIKRAVIIWKGEFTDEFSYMKKFISQ